MASSKRRRQRRNRELTDIRENATTLTEVRADLVPLAAEAAIRNDGTIAVKLISPGHGSSGYYSPEVLEAAATDRIYPAGTQMYWDHPTVSEGMERPERSLRDLAAVLETDALWQENGADGPGLYAQAKVFPGFRELLAEMAPHIGVSIRAAAEVEQGTVEGRRTRIIRRIVEGPSVDFVTKPGRGGKILAVLEAAGRADLSEARNVAEWFQSRIHLHFTSLADDMFGEGRLTKTERITLSSGIGAALDAFSAHVDAEAPQLLTRDLWDEPEPAESPITESQEDEMTPEQLNEALATALKPVTDRLSALEEAQAPNEETEEVEEAAEVTELRERLLQTEAKAHIAENAKVAAFPVEARKKIIEEAAKAAARTDDDKLDTKALDEATAKVVEAEVEYLSKVTGSPVRGAGGTDLSESTTTTTNEELEARRVARYQRWGLSEAAAKHAVAGRA